MKVERMLRVEEELWERWDGLLDEHVRKGMKKPNFSQLMRGKFLEVVLAVSRRMGDKDYIREMRALGRLDDRRAEMRQILLDAGLEDYNRKRLAKLMAIRGEKHPDVARFKRLMRDELEFRGERKAKKSLLKPKKIRVSKSGI